VDRENNKGKPPLIRLLQKYIGSTVINHILLVCCALLGMLIFIQLMTEMRDLGHGHYYIREALSYVSLSLPFIMYQLFPMAALLGALLGLGRLASCSELVVIRAAGVSLVQLAGFVVSATLVLLIVITLIGETVAPAMFAQASSLKQKAKDEDKESVEGLWFHQGNNFIRVHKLLPNNQLQGITRYQVNAQGQLSSVSYAKTANLDHGKWFFKDIVATEIYPDHVDSKKILSETWPVNLSYKPVTTQDEGNYFNLIQLYDHIQYLRQNGLNAYQDQFAFWQRLLQPLATLVMVCLALPFVLGSLRSSSTGLRMMIGILLGFAFFSLNRFAGYFSMLLQVPAFWAAIFPVALFTAVAWVLLARVR
jgi:lipopolysaccharide export system permease protein